MLHGPGQSLGPGDPRGRELCAARQATAVRGKEKYFTRANSLLKAAVHGMCKSNVLRQGWRSAATLGRGRVPAGQEQHPSVCGGEGRGAGGSARRPRPPQALAPVRLPLARQLSGKPSSEAASPGLCRPSFISASYSNACVEVRGEK